MGATRETQARQAIRGVGWKKNSTIAREKYEPIARAILASLTREPISFTELSNRVAARVPDFPGSVAWYTVSCARELEIQGKLVRTTGPTRYAKPARVSAAKSAPGSKRKSDRNSESRSASTKASAKASGKPVTITAPKRSASTQDSQEAALVRRMRELLADAGVRQVSEKKMFGSQAFLVRGHLCVAARAERMLCRIDPLGHEKAVKRNGCTGVIMRGRPYRGYLHIDADAVKTKRALQSWVSLALDYNRSLPSKRPK